MSTTDDREALLAEFKALAADLREPDRVKEARDAARITDAATRLREIANDEPRVCAILEAVADVLDNEAVAAVKMPPLAEFLFDIRAPIRNLEARFSAGYTEDGTERLEFRPREAIEVLVNSILGTPAAGPATRPDGR